MSDAPQQVLDTGGAHFKLVVIIVTIIFGLAIVAWGLLGILVAAPTASQTTVFDGLDWVVKLTLGALVGLLGGKAT
jgi:hypothetical protein